MSARINVQCQLRACQIIITSSMKLALFCTKTDLDGIKGGEYVECATKVRPFGI